MYRGSQTVEIRFTSRRTKGEVSERDAGCNSAVGTLCASGRQQFFR
jgi:hypothetical protein